MSHTTEVSLKRSRCAACAREVRLLVASLPPGESFEVSVVAAHLVARAPADGDADFVATKPRNPLHLDTIGGAGNSESGRRVT